MFYSQSTATYVQKNGTQLCTLGKVLLKKTVEKEHDKIVYASWYYIRCAWFIWLINSLCCGLIPVVSTTSISSASSSESTASSAISTTTTTHSISAATTVHVMGLNTEKINLSILQYSCVILKKNTHLQQFSCSATRLFEVLMAQKKWMFLRSQMSQILTSGESMNAPLSWCSVGCTMSTPTVEQCWFTY